MTRYAPKYALQRSGDFAIDNYNIAKPFSSFLPGVAGPHGIPMWAFYVNRGQCMCSIGVADKDHAIMEFLPATRAYQLAATQGFRTFVRVRRARATDLYEPFQSGPPREDRNRSQRMVVRAEELALWERNRALGLEFGVLYFTIPEDSYPGLARVVEIRNIGSRTLAIEMLDGLPFIVPYGLNDYVLKHIRRTMEALVSVTIPSPGSALFRVNAVGEDRPDISGVDAAHFYTGFLADRSDTPVALVADPRRIFGETTDFLSPAAFLGEVPYDPGRRQILENRYPSAMGYVRMKLGAGEAATYVSILGALETDRGVGAFLRRIRRPGYVAERRRLNRRIVSGLSSPGFTCSGSRAFDLYTRQTFLDNVLRGGMPVSLASGPQSVPVHLYGRKHGDLERDYNAFRIPASPYAQGNANFRDVCQNRRCDLFVNPDVRAQNVQQFCSLLQLDAFNPLVVGPTRYEARPTLRRAALLDRAVSADDRPYVSSLLSRPFLPGELMRELGRCGILLRMDPDSFLGELLAASRPQYEAEHGDGYWSDHWTYLLDLIENYLAVYPERLRALLFRGRAFTFFDSPYRVRPRSEKYVLANGRPMQLDAVVLDELVEQHIRARKRMPHAVREKSGRGRVYRTSLFEKLLCIIANKLASLDAAGVGIEMEADKPGWCDALNGLPGLLGSSVAETLELGRLLRFLLASLDAPDSDHDAPVPLCREIADFVRGLHRLLTSDRESRSRRRDFVFWDHGNGLKEAYRGRVRFGVGGERVSLRSKELRSFLSLALSKVDRGVRRAWDRKRGVIRTYFVSRVVRHEPVMEKTRGGRRQARTGVRGLPRFVPTRIELAPLPLFLEGPVHSFRIESDPERARRLHLAVKRSGLYDRRLGMYKLNEDLTAEPLEIGRIRTFARGWLENESIWLHMQYKYFLELLRTGLHDEFFREARRGLVPFMHPGTYGRSILENSSFIVSSVHPDSSLHGTGFVARLSGATAEFAHILSMMAVGPRPFRVGTNGRLELVFAPVLPRWLFTTRRRTERLVIEGRAVERAFPPRSFGFLFLGRIPVTYLNPRRADTFGPRAVRPTRIRVTISTDAGSEEIGGDTVGGRLAERIRSGRVESIDVTLGA